MSCAHSWNYAAKPSAIWVESKTRCVGLLFLLSLSMAACTKSGGSNGQPISQNEIASTVESAKSAIAETTNVNINKDAYTVAGNILADQFYKLITRGEEGIPGLLTNVNLPIDVDANDLYRLTSTNAATADNLYGGKRLLVRGAILGVEPTPDPQDYWVRLPGGVALFERERDFVSGLAPGYIATFACTYSGVKSVGYLLIGCQSIEKEAESFGKMTAIYPDPLGKDAASFVREIIKSIGPDKPPAGSACRVAVSLSMCRMPGQDATKEKNIVRTEAEMRATLSDMVPNDATLPASEPIAAASSASD